MINFSLQLGQPFNPPYNIALSNSSIADGNAVNATVGTLSASGNGTITYSLVSGDTSSFNISGTTLRCSETTSYGTKSSYSVTVRATNQAGYLVAQDKQCDISVTKPALLIEYLIVAGGGGGGDSYGLIGGGGGGAGGYVTNYGGTKLSLSTATNYTVTIGAGGSSAYSTRGVSGNNSVFSDLTAYGGGGGGGGADTAGLSGGCGGGSKMAAGVGTGSQGGNGGTGDNTNVCGGGGGGGASAAGGNATSTLAGGGGNGTSCSITGSSVAYAGGGGGGNGWTTGASGGSGGGGAGALYSPAANAVAGTANRGGGGGGGCNNGGTPIGAYGGSGVIILKIPSAYTASFSGPTCGAADTSVSGYKIYTVTEGTGTVSIS